MALASQNPVMSGSSKDFYETGVPGVLLVVFKDVMHGANRAETVAGTGRLREEFCYWFYRLLEKQGVATHLARARRPDGGGDGGLEDLQPRGLLVRRLDMLALEIITRFVARGYWADAHKVPLFEPGTVFEKPLVEFCAKWKRPVANQNFENLPPELKEKHGKLAAEGHGALLLPPEVTVDDPRITVPVAVALHRQARDQALRGRLLARPEEGAELERLALKVNGILRDFLLSQSWVLEDSKFEVGIAPGAEGDIPGAVRHFIVADELTQDSSRIRNAAGESLTKDLHRERKPAAAILEGYAALAEAIKAYAA